MPTWPNPRPLPDVPQSWTSFIIDISKLIALLITLATVIATWRTAQTNSIKLDEHGSALEEHGKVLEKTEEKIDKAAVKVEEAKGAVDDAKVKTDKKLDVIIAEQKKDK